MENLTFEQQLRKEIGCYRCTCHNASCHFTCAEYKEKVLPKLKNKQISLYK